MMVLVVLAVHYSAIMIPLRILLVEMGRAVQFHSAATNHGTIIRIIG